MQIREFETFLNIIFDSYDDIKIEIFDILIFKSHQSLFPPSVPSQHRIFEYFNKYIFTLNSLLK